VGNLPHPLVNALNKTRQEGDQTIDKSEIRGQILEQRVAAVALLEIDRNIINSFGCVYSFANRLRYQSSGDSRPFLKSCLAVRANRSTKCAFAPTPAHASRIF